MPRRACAGYPAESRLGDQVLRNRHPGTGAAETYRLFSYYRPDGAVVALVRAQSEDPRPASYTSGLPTLNVVRTFTYDSVGRRTGGSDPDTNDWAGGTPETRRGWRYLFNRVGDLVAVRDPRNSGQNFFYDLAGRLVGEQYRWSGTENHVDHAERPHADNTVGNLITLDWASNNRTLDVVYHYGAYPSWASGILPSGATSNIAGRATGVSDRAQRAVMAYDDRGNVTWTARQVAVLPEAPTLTITINSLDIPVSTEANPPLGNVVYDDLHTYERTATFDHAGRPLDMTLPADPDFDPIGGTPPPTIRGSLTYNRRGLPATATAHVGMDDHPIVAAIEYLRDGLVESITYGDDTGPDGMGRTPTASNTVYDIRRRPVRMTTMRVATGAGTMAGEELEAVTSVVDQQLDWDAANNLVRLVDHRSADEWPAGHRPQTVDIRHDALYRVVGAEFDYTQADGSRTPVDTATDWRDNFTDTLDPYPGSGEDPMQQEPAAMVSTLPTSRVASMTWTWDFLANTVDWDDDQSSFYERSVGTIYNGVYDSNISLQRPSAMSFATNIPAIGQPADFSDGGDGFLRVYHGRSGNVSYLTIRSQCEDAPAYPNGCRNHTTTTNGTSRYNYIRPRCSCAQMQHYEYKFDELNRIVEARRFDRNASTGDVWELQVRQRYRYDAANQRIIKQTLDQDTSSCGGAGVSCERVALYPYPGDFERRGLVRDASGLEYVPGTGLPTETQYVVAGARMVWQHPSGGVPNPYEREHRISVPLTDLIQTTAAAFDVRTGELLEASTYYPNGARETYLQRDDALTAPEPSGFTGKEGDEEVGLVYFGERYLIPRIGRWASPDPLHVHAVGGGEALNSFHYVAGNLLVSQDPLGLSGCTGEGCGDSTGAFRADDPNGNWATGEMTRDADGNLSMTVNDHAGLHVDEELLGSLANVSAEVESEGAGQNAAAAAADSLALQRAEASGTRGLARGAVRGLAGAAHDTACTFSGGIPTCSSSARATTRGVADALTGALMPPVPGQTEREREAEAEAGIVAEVGAPAMANVAMLVL